MGNELSSPVEKIVQLAEGTSGAGDKETAVAVFCISGCQNKFRDAFRACTSDGGYPSELRRSTPACREAAKALRSCLHANFYYYKAWHDRGRAIDTNADFFSTGRH